MADTTRRPVGVSEDSITEGTHAAGSMEGFWTFLGRLSRWAWIPLPVFVVAIVVLAGLRTHRVFEPWWLMPTVNGLIFIGASLVAAVMAARAYRSGASAIALSLGGGVLTFGLACLAGAVLVATGRINGGVTAHNLLALLAGGINLGGATAVTIIRHGSPVQASRPVYLRLVYGGCLLVGVIIPILAAMGVFPVFITPQGTTHLRTAVLTITVAAYLFSALVFRLIDRYAGVSFLRLYCLGLALTAVGLSAVGIGQVGSPLCWAGRLAQALGQIYVVACLFSLSRQKGGASPGLTLGESFQRLEEALRKSEDRYRVLFESMSEGFALHEIITDERGCPCDYRFLDVNPAFERLTGLKRSDIVGRRVSEVLPNVERRWIDDYGQVALTGKSLHLDAYTASLDRWFNVVAYCPAPRQFAVVFSDITDRMRAVEDLKRTTQRYALLSATAGSLLAASDPQAIVEDLCCRVMSHLGCDVFFNYLADPSSGRLRLNACGGIPAEEARDIRWLDYGVAVCGCVARDRQRIIAEDIQCTPDERTSLVKSYGVQAYCCHPLMVGDRLIGTLSFGSKRRAQFDTDEIELMRAVTDQVAVAMERILVEQALRESEERFRVMADGTPLMIWVTDAGGNMQFVNRAYCEFFGVTLDQVQDGGWQPLVHPDDMTAYRDAYLGALRDRKSFHAQVRVRRHDGEWRWVESHGLPQFSGAGQFVGMAGSSPDITERRHTQEELERRVRERTAELQKTNEELKRSNEDLQQFAYVSSHDLQEPLRMVASYVQLLEQRYGDQLDEDAKTFIGFAVEGAQRMSTLIKDLLTYSRVQSRGQPFVAVDCERLLRIVADNLRLRIRETQARITHDPLPTVMADESQVMQVFQNLIDNAIKFRRPDVVPEVHISAERRNNEILFHVRDNGIGIEPQYHDRIFVIFQRLHTRQKYPGTGIGLSIVKRIVERHGGRIHLESQPDQGSTFHFTLPVA